MADDPTLQLSLRRTHECPTCGHNMLPEESQCGLCGTILPRDMPSPASQENAPPSSVVSSSPETSEPTLITSLPPPPPPVQEEASKVVPPLPPSSPPRVQKEASKAVPSSPPPPLFPPVMTLPELPLESKPVQQPVLPQAVQVQPNPFASWGKLAAGALALFLVSFFAAKMFSSLRAEKRAEVPSSGTTVERTGEKTTIADKKEEKAVLPSPPLASPVPQLVGRVTTAEQLLPIRIFGADPNDELRGVAACRTQVEASVQGIRDAYNAQIVENPQALGAVVLELNVAPEGQVTSVAVHTTGSISRALQQAIMDAVKALRFAPVQGEEVKVFYPLLLSPEKVDPASFVSHVKEVWPGRYKMLAATPVPVYAEASESAQEVGSLGPGLFLSVVSSQDGWLGALSPKGKVGYVRREAIFPRVENTVGADAKG